MKEEDWVTAVDVEEDGPRWTLRRVFMLGLLETDFTSDKARMEFILCVAIPNWICIPLLIGAAVETVMGFMR